MLSLIPFVGWVLGIVGVVPILRGMKEFSNYYQDEKIYQDPLTGVKYYIIAIIAAAVSIAAFTIGIWSATGFTSTFELKAGFGVGLIAFIVGLVVAFVFFILASSYLKRIFNTLAQKSGEASFATAGTLLWISSILTIICVGLILIFIACMFVTIGFSAMKSRQYQQHTPQPNGYGYTPPPTQPAQAANMATNQKHPQLTIRSGIE